MPDDCRQRLFLAKVEHWRGVSAIFGREAAPVLEFAARHRHP